MVPQEAREVRSVEGKVHSDGRRLDVCGGNWQGVDAVCPVRAAVESIRDQPRPSGADRRYAGRA